MIKSLLQIVSIFYANYLQQIYLLISDYLNQILFKPRIRFNQVLSTLFKRTESSAIIPAFCQLLVKCNIQLTDALRCLWAICIHKCHKLLHLHWLT